MSNTPDTPDPIGSLLARAAAGDRDAAAEFEAIRRQRAQISEILNRSARAAAWRMISRTEPEPCR
ncbi:hypothetical protein ACFVIM_34045 [Streptomyces sp. NPDC057638]|uniref:hypothetical protein n=1 Tax=Streptomyces sp. NPDC057638 TaxID=3346190 RepID=UPI0036BC89CB